jgi:DNA-binding transcriptional LysR family regulator
MVTMLHGRMLRYLDEIARTGSIRQASIRLNVAASAISRQLLALEQDVGGDLFERLPRGLKLTPMGEILVAHVRETMSGFEQATDRIAQLKGLLQGRIAIGTMGGLSAGLLADAVLGFREKHPRVEIAVKVLGGEALTQAVLDGDVDLGLAYELQANPRVHIVGRIEQRLGAVVAPGHPLAAKAGIRLTDCLEYPLLVADESLSLRRITNLLVPAMADLRPVLETNSIDLLKRLARVSPNVAILNFADVSRDLESENLAFVPFVETAAHQNIAIFHRATGSLDASVSVMAREIETVFGNRFPSST